MTAPELGQVSALGGCLQMAQWQSCLEARVSVHARAPEPRPHVSYRILGLGSDVAKLCI